MFTTYIIAVILPVKCYQRCGFQKKIYEGGNDHVKVVVYRRGGGSNLIYFLCYLNPFLCNPLKPSEKINGIVYSIIIMIWYMSQNLLTTFLLYHCGLFYWYFISSMCGTVVTTSMQLLKLNKVRKSVCADSNPHGMSEIRHGEDMWQWPPLEIILNAFFQSNIPQKQFIIIIISVGGIFAFIFGCSHCFFF